jgi:type II secretory pathway pseudopilin PulG
MRRRKDIGETLVEVMLAIVIIGLTVTGLLSGLATAGNAGNVQRISVQADTYMRNYADAIKAAAAQQCVDGKAKFTVSYQPPVESKFEVLGAAVNECPSIDAKTLQLTKLTVVGPRGFQDHMEIKVRTP